jgi:hypothetical protein
MATIVAALVLLEGCNSATPSAATSSAAAPSSAPSASGGTAAPPATAIGGLPSQTDTDWGRIWDTVPAAFPVYPGAVASGEAQTEPVSAIFTVAAEEARAVAAWMQAELERDAYRTEALNGPLEDGGFVLDSTGDAGCRIEVAVTPLGGMTIVTVRYGADCPSP